MDYRRPERLLEYFVTVGLSEPLEPLIIDSERPISDIIVVSGKEAAPEGYELITRTVSGLSANLTGGAVFSNPLYLAFSRSPTLAPITDVILIYSDKDEKCPPGYVMLPANLNKGSVGRTVHLCYTRAKGKPPLLGLAVLMPKKERCGHRYHAISSRLLNGGSFSDDLQLAIKRGYTSPLDIQYKSALLDRFPRINIKGAPLPDSIPMFCYPEGISLVSFPPPLPTHSSFVLTTHQGLQMYGCCVTFYEPWEGHLPPLPNVSVY